VRDRQQRQGAEHVRDQIACEIARGRQDGQGRAPAEQGERFGLHPGGPLEREHREQRGARDEQGLDHRDEPQGSESLTKVEKRAIIDGAARQHDRLLPGLRLVRGSGRRGLARGRAEPLKKFARPDRALAGEAVDGGVRAAYVTGRVGHEEGAAIHQSRPQQQRGKRSHHREQLRPARFAIVDVHLVPACPGRHQTIQRPTGQVDRRVYLTIWLCCRSPEIG
jgi:hypothetical protein